MVIILKSPPPVTSAKCYATYSPITKCLRTADISVSKQWLIGALDSMYPKQFTRNIFTVCTELTELTADRSYFDR